MSNVINHPAMANRHANTINRLIYEMRNACDRCEELLSDVDADRDSFAFGTDRFETFLDDSEVLIKLLRTYMEKEAW